MEKGIQIFSVFIVIIPTRLLCQGKRTLLELNFYQHIQVHEENEFCHCLFTSFTKHEFGIFTGSRAVDGNEMYQKVWCTCKVVVLPCQAIPYLPFSSSPPHLYFPCIIYDTFVMSQKQNILGANGIAPADSIPNVFRLIGSSFSFWLGK